MVAIWENNVRQANLADPAREAEPTGDRQRGDRWPIRLKRSRWSSAIASYASASSPPRA